MVGKIKEILEREGYSKLYQRLVISFIILTLILILFLGYYFFFYEKACANEECFKKAFDKCNRVNFLKDNEQALWLYQITGREKGAKCKVKVTLMMLKQGTIENQKLEGSFMICNVIRDNALNSEGDLSSCKGLLKEKMQEIIIQRMHNYILKNVGEIKEEFNQP
ncbi:hypothetical protein J4218_01740 [Candidatus Pacearchaeota archaeon]|nr:hypothetical protein [uncultured archaeon]MBS3078820.1 hypothetical protein [Candidatus Pacearchaeota archaeon]